MEDPEVIIRDHYLVSISRCQALEDPQLLAKVYMSFARYCHEQYHDNTLDDDIMRLESLRSQKQKELESLEEQESQITNLSKPKGKVQDQAKESARTRKVLQNLKDKAFILLKSDSAELHRLTTLRSIFSSNALENLLRGLSISDDFDDAIPNFVALWFSQIQSEQSLTVVAANILQVPCRKWLSLINQLSSRILSDVNSFQSTLKSLMQRVCLQHPYHSHFQIFAIKNSQHKSDTVQSKSRQIAATSLIQSILSQRLSPTREINHLCSAYLNLAVYKMNLKEHGSKPIDFTVVPKHRYFTKDLPKLGLPPPTLQLKIKFDLDYKDVPRIISFDSAFSLASGINAPKILRCLTSEGIWLKELVLHRPFIYTADWHR